ncbi:hypothetical protein BGZ75_003224 [Mortierella antarctica]|nr:hypothetical protein BGZ75_003224 [Mortierella antarctica]
MPPKKAPAASASRNAATKTKAAPYNKNSKKNTLATKKPANARTPTKATFNKYKNLNSNLTSELDSLLGDLNSQLQRKKTKRDLNNPSAVPDSERKLNEAQEKHESLQQDMERALDGISSLGK